MERLERCPEGAQLRGTSAAGLLPQQHPPGGGQCPPETDRDSKRERRSKRERERGERHLGAERELLMSDADEETCDCLTHFRYHGESRMC